MGLAARDTLIFSAPFGFGLISHFLEQDALQAVRSPPLKHLPFRKAQQRKPSWIGDRQEETDRRPHQSMRDDAGIRRTAVDPIYQTAVQGCDVVRDVFAE